MQWKVNLLFICAILVSIYGQEVLIEDNVTPIKPTSKSETTYEIANDDEILSTIETGVEKLDDETGENGGDGAGNPDPDNETGEVGSLESENVELEPAPDGDLPSNEETEPSKEESAVVRSSEEGAPVESNESVSVEDLVTEDSIISTTHGPVQGHLWNESPEIISFYDIPYGRISTFFQPPELPETWEEIHHVAAHTKRCPQLRMNEETRTVEASKDIECLTLSIFVPRTAARNASVLFHIHDGSFTTGSGDPSIYGPDHLLAKGIILVLPNYRLGPLGFLCLQNDTAPGNAGLKDLTLALNWTKFNIDAFGGNSQNIVVSGDGSSGALAGYLALSPTSRDNVHKVITESGSVVSHWAIDRDPIETATSLAEKIRTSHKEHTFNDDLFSEIDLEMLLIEGQGIHLSPCVEEGSHSFISKTPWYILKNEKISKSFMIGSASYAGLHEALSHDEHSISQLNEYFGYFIPNDLEFKNGEEEKLEVAKQIKTQYFGDSVIDAKSIGLALSYTDAWYLSPVIRAARVLVEAGATVYFYEFAFVGDLNRERTALESEVNGSARGDIVGYLFTQSDQLPEPASKEEAMIELMTDLWISFINNGTPSSTDVEWNQWELTEAEEEEWLWIGSEPQPRKGCHVDRLQLWTDVYEAHFVERNLCYGLAWNPALILAAISVVGLFPKTMQSR